MNAQMFEVVVTGTRTFRVKAKSKMQARAKAESEFRYVAPVGVAVSSVIERREGEG